MRPGVAYFDDIIKIAFTLVKTWLVKIWFFFQNIFSALRVLAFLVKDSLMARTCTTDDNKTCTKALPQSLKTLFQLILIKPLSRYLPRGEKLSKSNALIYMKFSLYEIVITPTLIMIVWSTLMHLLRWFITYVTLMKNLHKLVLPTVLSNSIYKNRTEQNNHN